MKIPVAAVTGGFGLVGSQIVNRLITLGWRVKILSRSKMHKSTEKINVINSDLSNDAALKILVEGVDAIFHCAGELYNENIMHSTNVEGTSKLLNVSKQSSAKFFFFLSSAGVIAKTNDKIIKEDTICNPQNLYEKTKYESEKLVQNANLNMSVCILRPTNIVDSVKPGIVLLPIINGWREKFKVIFKGKENAHIVHVKDVASAAMFFLEKKFSGISVFFISIDDDYQNNVIAIYKSYLKLLNQKNKIFFIMPLFVPYYFRKFFRNDGLHGKVSFSNHKLINTGFEFQYNVQMILTEIHNNRTINK